MLWPWILIAREERPFVGDIEDRVRLDRSTVVVVCGRTGVQEVEWQVDAFMLESTEYVFTDSDTI